MKQLLLVAACALALSACASKGDSDKSSGAHSEMPAPSSHVGERTLFTNKWKMEYTDGTALMEFTPTSVTTTNYCNNGRVASVTVRARNTSTHIQVLESKKSGDEDCYVTAQATLGYSYKITIDKLAIDGGILTAY